MRKRGVVMHPVIAKIGPVSFYSYGLMVGFGFLFGILLAAYLAKKINIDPGKIIDVSIFVLVFSIIGARLFYIIFYFNELKSFWDAFAVWNGGLVFYGGLFFGILGVYAASKVLKLKLLDILDIATPATALGYAFGRIGCFLNGCCYGEVCSLPWGVSFPHVVGLRHPTQIYSMLSGLAMMFIFLAVFNKRKFAGQVFALGLIFYPIYRFLIEFVRVNPKVFLGLTQAQIGSVFILIAGIALYGILGRKISRG